MMRALISAERLPLRQLPNVRDAALFGSGLHIVVTDEQEAIAQIQTLLADRNLSTAQLQVVTPSMEDVV